MLSVYAHSEMGIRSSRKKKTCEWVDAINNDFFLTSGRVQSHCITFHVKRRRGAPALTFDIGESIVLSHNKCLHTAYVISFIPHNPCGSVVAASGLLSLDNHEGIARALDISSNNESISDVFYHA